MVFRQRVRIMLSFFACCIAAVVCGAQDWRQKVDPWVLDTAGKTLTTEFLLVLVEQADVSGANFLGGKDAKGRYVFERLREVARRTQPAIIGELLALGAEYRSYWINNMIWVRADLATIEALARRADVARLHANPWVHMDLPDKALAAVAGSCPQGGVEASLTHVGAEVFWNRGIAGENVVIGGADTGYQWDHPALRGSYRGWNGAIADHAYSWHDAIHEGGGFCGSDVSAPCDDNGHGTHTLGTMVGDDGSNRFGMAPGARWIGCRNMNQGVGSPASYSECFEFFLAPTDLQGQNADPAMAPHVVNNSWSCPPSEGCSDPEVLRRAVENLRAAGVVVVVAAGNTGPSCGSIDTPAPIYEAAFTVGNSTLADTIANSSSRGPVLVDGSQRLKPDITAPGTGICSTIPGDGHLAFSGTSMAGPHVAGLVALLISAEPCLAGDVDAIEAHIEATALPRTSVQTCGDLPGSQVPNHTFGHGVIRAVLPESRLCSDDIFDDAFESGDTSAWSP